jgi:hypothetical protein
VALTLDAAVEGDIDFDALATLPGADPFDGQAPLSYSGAGGSVGSAMEVRFTNGDRRSYYAHERVDVYFSESTTVQRHAPNELRVGWQVITFVDGQYDSLFQRLTDVIHARLPPQQRVMLTLWLTAKEQLLERFESKAVLYNRLANRGLTSSYGTFTSWFSDDEDGVIAPQQFDEFKVLASEIDVYAKSPAMLDGAFKAVQHERGRNRATGRMLRGFLRAVVSGEGYEKALASARKFDAAMADVFAAVEVLEVASIHPVCRSAHV